MDSVTQIALGAAIGELVLGRKVGWRAAVAGGVLGTLPDLDVFIPLGDPVSDFTYHRSATHSVFVLALAAPVLAEAAVRLQKGMEGLRARWYVMAWLVLLTHPVLDCFTTYGTQILWPFDKTPIGWSTIFIIDPAYTLPLVIGVAAALALRRSPRLGHRLNVAGLILSTCYLGATVAAKARADDAAARAIAASDMNGAVAMTIPGPFTSMFWRIVAVDGTHYHNAYYSVWDDPSSTPVFTRHARETELLSGLSEDWATQRLRWFSRGFYRLKLRGSSVLLSDLRMGFEPHYVFTFRVGERANGRTKPLPETELMAVTRDVSGLPWVWQRIWSRDVPRKP